MHVSCLCPPQAPAMRIQYLLSSLMRDYNIVAEGKQSGMERHWHACWIDVRAMQTQHACSMHGRWPWGQSDPSCTWLGGGGPGHASDSVSHRCDVHGLLCTVEGSKRTNFHELSVWLMCPVLQATTAIWDDANPVVLHVPTCRPGREIKAPVSDCRLYCLLDNRALWKFKLVHKAIVQFVRCNCVLLTLN
jgi:hypothetical protein